MKDGPERAVFYALGTMAFPVSYHVLFGGNDFRRSKMVFFMLPTCSITKCCIQRRMNRQAAKTLLNSGKDHLAPAGYTIERNY